MNLDKFTIVSYDQIAGFDRQAGMLALVMDEINDFTLSQEEEKNDITGKGGSCLLYTSYFISKWVYRH